MSAAASEGAKVQDNSKNAISPQSATPPRPSRRWRPWIKGVLVAAWILFIWSRSLVPGAASSNESLRVVNLVAPLLEACGIHSLDTMQFVVRKLGHFTEYFVLGALTQLPPVPHGRRQRWAQLALLGAVPALDETLQLFVPLREGALRDVGIDIAGALCGLLVVALIGRLATRRG